MTVTAATLKARFAEFSPTADALCTAVIAEATLLTSAAVFTVAADFDMAVLYRAAHLLSLSPGGATARLEGVALASPSSAAADLGRSTYGAALLHHMRVRAGGPHMSGAGPLR